MPADAVVAALRHAWETLAARNIPMAVMGGLAVTVWKHGRMTQDVDLLLEIDERQLDETIRVLFDAGFRSKGPQPLIQIGEIEFLQLEYEPPETYLDIQVDFLLAKTPYQKLALSRRRHVPPTELGVEVDVMACEDLIVHKLLAMRIQDRVDAFTLLQLNREELDMEYLLTWIGKLDLQPQFKEVWNDAFPGESPPEIE